MRIVQHFCVCEYRCHGSVQAPPFPKSFRAAGAASLPRPPGCGEVSSKHLCFEWLAFRGPFLCAAMAAHIESEATFEARVREMGLGDVWDKMKDKRLNTYAQFAFGANFTPGHPDETQLLQKIIIPLVGEDESRD